MKQSIVVKIFVFFALSMSIIDCCFAESSSKKEYCSNFFSKIAANKGVKEESTKNGEATFFEQMKEATDAIKKALFGSEEKMQEIERNLNRDLLFIYGGTPENSKVINRKVLDELEGLPLKEQTGKRIVGLSQTQVNSIFSQVKDHPVARFSRLREYEKKQAGLGYCFGRAMTAHLTALAEGVDKSSIRKIWAVGDLDNGGGHWNYHVTTIVRDNKGSWYAIDPAVADGPLPINEWYAEIKTFDTAGNMRIYSTEANRFIPTESKKYSNKMLGDPIFSNYFNDLIESFKKRTKSIMDSRRKAQAMDEVKEEAK